jgi:hypothetical protein
MRQNEKIHVCKNDCILYHAPQFEDLEKCPIYRFDRFNHRKDGGDDENCNKTEEKMGLKMCFYTFLSFLVLKHWFSNKKESELL